MLAAICMVGRLREFIVPSGLDREECGSGHQAGRRVPPDGTEFGVWERTVGGAAGPDQPLRVRQFGEEGRQLGTRRDNRETMCAAHPTIGFVKIVEFALSVHLPADPMRAVLFVALMFRPVPFLPKPRMPAGSRLRFPTSSRCRKIYMRGHGSRVSRPRSGEATRLPATGAGISCVKSATACTVWRSPTQ